MTILQQKSKINKYKCITATYIKETISWKDFRLVSINESSLHNTRRNFKSPSGQNKSKYVDESLFYFENSNYNTNKIIIFNISIL